MLYASGLPLIAMQVVYYTTPEGAIPIDYDITEAP